MTYEGKNHRRRTVKTSENVKKGPNRELIRLIAAAWLLLIAAGARFLFPKELADFRGEVLEAISISVPYKEAVSVLGEAVNGKESLSEAVKKAWSYAFLGEVEEIEVSERDEEAHIITIAEEEKSVRAEEDGTVVAVGDSVSFGGYVIVEGAGGEKVYDGLGDIYVTEGDEVKAGDEVGLRREGSDEA